MNGSRRLSSQPYHRNRLHVDCIRSDRTCTLFIEDGHMMLQYADKCDKPNSPSKWRCCSGSTTCSLINISSLFKLTCRLRRGSVPSWLVFGVGAPWRKRELFISRTARIVPKRRFAEGEAKDERAMFTNGTISWTWWCSWLLWFWC